MERLTGRWPSGIANYGHGKLPDVIDRLAKIEDIFGDEYDPDRPLEQWEQDWLAEVQRRRAQRGVEQDD